MLKKINVFLVLAIFIFSIVPVVLAEKIVGTTENGEKIGVLPTGAAVSTKDTTGKTNDKVEEVKSKIATAVQDLNQMKKTIAQNKELVGTEKKIAIQKLNDKRKELATNYKLIKEKYDKAKKDYQNSREKVLEWKKKVQSCKKDENCTKENKDYRKYTQTHLVNLADVILENLNKLENQIEASDINSTEQTELLSEIKTQIEEIKNAKTTLENKTEVSEEDIKAAVTTIKTSWEKTKPLMKRGAGELVNAKLGNLIVQVNQLETKFTQTRDKLKAKGEDVTKLDAALKSFKEKLDLANTNWNLAKSKFTEAKTATDTNKVIKEAHAYQQKARDYIDEARDDLRDIVKEIKEDGKEIKVETKTAAKEVKKNENDLAKEVKKTTKENNDTDDESNENSSNDSDLVVIS